MTYVAGPEAHWRAALAEGRFLLQRAQSSGTVYFPPRLAEPGTGETDLEWVEASGMGIQLLPSAKAHSLQTRTAGASHV